MLKDLNILQIVIFFSLIIDLFICRKIYDYLFSKKIDFHYLEIIIFSLIISISLYFSIKINISFFLIIGLLYFIFLSLEYKVNIYKSFFVSLIFWCLLIFTYFLSFKITNNIYYFMHFDVVTNSYNYKYISILLEKLIFITYIYIYIFSSYRLLYKSKENKKKYLNLFFTPILTNFVYMLILTCIVLESKNNKAISNSNIFILILSIIVVSNISLLFIIFCASKNKKQLFYMDILNKKNEYSRELYHDMKNHILCMKYDANIEKSNSYIEKVELLLEEYGNKFNTGNIILDTVLHEKNNLCLRNNITFTCDINFKNCSFMEDEDICSIFSNLLDNAIEACLKVEPSKRNIILKGLSMDSIFVAKLSNSTNNDINFKDNEFMTTKTNKLLHGIGLKSVKSTLKKYDGEILFDFDKNIFYTKILIPIP